MVALDILYCRFLLLHQLNVLSLHAMLVPVCSTILQQQILHAVQNSHFLAQVSNRIQLQR